MSRFIPADDSPPYSERKPYDPQAEREKEAAHTYIAPEDAREAGDVRPIDDVPSDYELRLDARSHRANTGYAHLKGRR